MGENFGGGAGRAASPRPRFLMIVALATALATLMIPTLHSAAATRVFSGEQRHDTIGPTGSSGIAFSVARGDTVAFEFEARNATSEVSVRFGESLATYRNSFSPYNVTATTGHFRFVAPSDGVVDINWRPIQPGESVTVYRVSVVPNFLGLSLLPLLD